MYTKTVNKNLKLSKINKGNLLVLSECAVCDSKMDIW